MNEWRIKLTKSAPRPSSRRIDERGAGLISTMFGAVTFLSFVALGAHTMVGLYAKTVLTTVAWDEARLVAQDSSTGPSDTVEAEQRIRERLASMDNVAVSWAVDGDSVRLNVAADRPALVPSAMASSVPLTHFDRTVTVHREHEQ